MRVLSAHANWVRRAIFQARAARRMDRKVAIRTIDAVRLAGLDGVTPERAIGQPYDRLGLSFEATRHFNAHQDYRRAKRDRIADATLLAATRQPMKRLRPYQAMVAEAERKTARRLRHDHDVTAENQREAVKCTPHVKEKLVERQLTWWPRETPTVPRCECEACFGGRKLRAWLDNDGGQQERDPETGQLLRPDDAPDFAETCQALSAHDRCQAAVCFPDAIDRAAIGPLSVTVNGMPGRTIDWLDMGRIRDDGLVKAKWVGKIVTPGPFEAQSIRSWDVAQYVAHHCPSIAVHEGYETERGYLAHPAWYADAERLEREYAGLRRADITEPLDPEDDDLDEFGRVPAGWYPANALKDSEGRVVLGLAQYEYLRRQIEVRKFLDTRTGKPIGMALGTWMPRHNWNAFHASHKAHEKKLRERAKIAMLLRSLRFDASDPKIVARIAALNGDGRTEAIKALYRKHNERGIAIPS